MRHLVWLAAAFTLAAQTPEIRLVRIATGVSAPTDIQGPGDGSGRLFFVQQNGIVRVFRDGQLAATPFLDITSRTRGGGEQGLLGLAFPPGFNTKQYFYVNYTDRNGDTVVARYRVPVGRPDQADAASEEVILTQDQPFSNHNGGQLRFGPDGFLWIGLGDGGSGGDPMGFAQNPRSRLGKMLRIDVESGGSGFRVPPGNPFSGNPSFLPEIWAIGLRNPWRYSFDRETGDLWIADVGQNRAEEVNFTPASSRGGENYGWNRTEGLRCFAPNCNVQGLTMPVLEYTRNLGVSVTGGFVYRGRLYPALRGTYFYADYDSGRIWGVRREGEGFVNRLLLASGLNITTFGEDEASELYLADQRGGAIYRIESTEEPPPPRLAISSVVNAASNAAGVVAGSAATVYVQGVTDAPGVISAPSLPLPLALGGVQVTVNGSPAPLFAVANTGGVEQVNFQVPFETAGERAVIVVARNGEASAPVDAALLAVQPGIFTLNGTDAIVVHHATNALVSESQPLQRGEYAYLYVTGIGAVENTPATGAAAPAGPLATARNSPTVTLDGVPAEVLFAGLAPGFTGVYQINIRVSEAVATGARDLVVTAAGVASRPAVVPIQ